MQAEVIAIGDELTSGQRLDTNSQWLSQRLGEMGIGVLYHSTVGDDVGALTEVLTIAIRRVPLVVVTGGLGPTADDLTRQAIAEATERPLHLREEILDQIRSRFAHRGRMMPAQNQVQAMFPEGSRVINNPHGTAPGIDLEVTTPTHGCRLFALPGVPAEMQEMWEGTVRGSIAQHVGVRQVIRHHRIKCFGAGESQLESMLPDLIRRDRQPRVGITVHRATITLRISARGPDENTCRELMRPTVETIHDCLGTLIFGQDDDELEHAVVRELERRQQRLVVCEWGTAGLIARWLGAVDDTSRLQASLVVPTLDSLQTLLQSSPPVGFDQAALLHWMAERLKERFPADHALAIGPLPPTGDASPRIFLGITGPKGTVVVDHAYVGHPDVVLERAAKQALDLLRHELLSD